MKNLRACGSQRDRITAATFCGVWHGSEILRAIEKLVENACKFTPPDGTVRLALSQQDGQALISVADTGIGIPEADLPQLFNCSHRGRNATPYPGSGLGLAIVKAIVTAHKGRVEVKSAADLSF